MINIIPVTSALYPYSAANAANTAPAGGPNALETGKSSAEPVSFSDFFKDAVGQIEELEAVKNQDAYNLALGEVDNLAEIAVNEQKYQLAVQLMVEIRNKLLDGYAEIMRINI